MEEYIKMLIVVIQEWGEEAFTFLLGMFLCSLNILTMYC